MTVTCSLVSVGAIGLSSVTATGFFTVVRILSAGLVCWGDTPPESTHPSLVSLTSTRLRDQ